MPAAVQEFFLLSQVCPHGQVISLAHPCCHQDHFDSWTLPLLDLNPQLLEGD